MVLNLFNLRSLGQIVHPPDGRWINIGGIQAEVSRAYEVFLLNHPAWSIVVDQIGEGGVQAIEVVAVLENASDGDIGESNELDAAPRDICLRDRLCGQRDDGAVWMNRAGIDIRIESAS